MFKIGFIQGRLSPQIGNAIQAFPWPYWRQEFITARECDLRLMEWTLDYDRLYDNPFMTKQGQKEIGQLSIDNGIVIESVTGDFFMQAPFFKAEGKTANDLLEDLKRVLESSIALGVSKVVLPLVDNGRIENQIQEQALIKGLNQITYILISTNTRILFESDYSPAQLAGFIKKLDTRYFGINYDIGNSAALGYRPKEECTLYGEWIQGVHVKDRLLNGPTVPLGTGDADIPGALLAIHASGYSGSFLLQTARAADGDHIGALCRYRDMLKNWLLEMLSNVSRTH